MKKKSIWIIDDDSIFKIIIQKLISKVEVFDNVKTFSNGLEASIAFKELIIEPELIPDIILLDIEMPLLDGWGFIEEIKTIIPNYKDKNLNIYISSSSIAAEDKIKADSNACVFGYLTKPITLDDLIKIAT